MGKNNIREAIALGLKLGYMTRRQLPRQRDGTWGRAVDQLALPKCGETGRAGRHVKRAWFDGSLSRDAMAAFIYLRAGTGKGPSIFASELQSRFGWSRPKAMKVLGELIARKLVGRTVLRSKLGRVVGVTYTPNPASSWSIWSTVKKPGTGSQGDGKRGHLRTVPPHGLSTREPLYVRVYAEVTLHMTVQRRPLLLMMYGERLCHRLSFSISRWRICRFSQDMLNDAEAELDAVEQVCTDRDLKAALRNATQGRVHAEILSPAGLFSVRMLAAMLLARADTTEDYSAADALSQVLEAIRERIGNRKNDLAQRSERHRPADRRLSPPCIFDRRLSPAIRDHSHIAGKEGPQRAEESAAGAGRDDFGDQAGGRSQSIEPRRSQRLRWVGTLARTPRQRRHGHSPHSHSGDDRRRGRWVDPIVVLFRRPH